MPDEIEDETDDPIAHEIHQKTYPYLAGVLENDGSSVAGSVISGLSAAIAEFLWRHRPNTPDGPAEARKQWDMLGDEFFRQMAEQDQVRRDKEVS